MAIGDIRTAVHTRKGRFNVRLNTLVPQALDGLVGVRVNRRQCEVLYLRVQLVDALARIEHLPRVTLELVEERAHLLLELFFLVPLRTKVACGLV